MRHENNYDRHFLWGIFSMYCVHRLSPVILFILRDSGLSASVSLQPVCEYRNNDGGAGEEQVGIIYSFVGLLIY